MMATRCYEKETEEKETVRNIPSHVSKWCTFKIFCINFHKTQTRIFVDIQVVANTRIIVSFKK